MYSGHSCSLWILFTLHWLFTLATTPRELYLPKKRWCRILTLERCANISPMWLCNEYWPHYWWYKVDALIATMYGKNRQQLCTPFFVLFFYSILNLIYHRNHSWWPRKTNTDFQWIFFWRLLWEWVNQWLKRCTLVFYMLWRWSVEMGHGGRLYVFGHATLI